MYLFCPFKPRTEEPIYNIKKGLPVPQPRSGHRIVCFQDNVYSFGGYNPNIGEAEGDDIWNEMKPLFQELWVFNTYRKSWTKLKHSDCMPKELASHAAVLCGENMFVFGGTALPFGDASSNSVYVCHLPSGKWTKMKTHGRKPSPMYGQGVFREESTLYVVGGTSGFDYSCDVHTLDLLTGRWTYILPYVYDAPLERYRHEIVKHNGRLWMLGGGTSDVAFDLENIPAFSLSDCEWETIRSKPDPRTNTYPSPRKCHVALCHKGYVYIHGGFDSTQAFQDTWRIELETSQWEKLDDRTNKPVYFHAGAISEDGCLYLFGGVSHLETERTNEVVQIWLEIPKLQRIAWEALLHYFPDLVLMSRNKLRALGIPLYVVKNMFHPFPAFG